MTIDDLLREVAPQALGALVRRFGQFDASEDAIQEALLAAAQTWPRDGVPDNPRAWLIAVASRRLVDEFRSESARRRRELEFSAAEDPPEISDSDDTLALLFLCAHPSLSAPSQLALTLRAVGGLTTAEIAAAFLVPEATMAQRISRAKQTIRKSGRGFEAPPPEERADRLRVVRQVLYLIFNEGYTTSGGPQLQRAELATEAIRLGRLLLRAEEAAEKSAGKGAAGLARGTAGAGSGTAYSDGETAGLLALMLLVDARRSARADEHGDLIPLDRQDRSLWDAGQIREGIALVSATLGRTPVGPYQLQAAIAALHDEAPDDVSTDWPQILALYEVLERVAPGPVVTLNKAVVVARTKGPLAGLAVLGELDADTRMAGNHRLEAVRAHLLEQAGQRERAREAYAKAARMTTSVPEQRYLTMKAALAAPEAATPAKPKAAPEAAGTSALTLPEHADGRLTGMMEP